MINNLSQQVRLIIACAFSVLIIVLWQIFYVEPIVEQQQTQRKFDEQTAAVEKVTEAKLPAIFISRDEAIAMAHEKVAIENEYVKGSINLVGARIDDLLLQKYKKDLREDSTNIELLSPAVTKNAYFVEFGWLNASDEQLDLPNKKTKWVASSKKLLVNQSLMLNWTSAQGIKFAIELTLDDKYLFNIKQSVKNEGKSDVILSSYALVSKMTPSLDKATVVHEGGIGVFNKKLKEFTYEDINDETDIKIAEQPSWIGFSDKYWLTAIILDSETKFNSKFSHVTYNKVDRYQADMASYPFKVAAGTEQKHSLKFFAGAKEIEILDSYEQIYGIPLFDRAVDFGILYLITKPTLKLLHYFYDIFGNFGIAILILTVLIKLLLYPLAKKGFLGMNRLKELQPKVALLKKRMGDDPVAFQKEMVQLYKKENVNPMSGCLPLLLQIPVFFALYKVLYVSIEMRQAPFALWVKDLSAPDPTNIFTLFGLIPWDPPSFMMVGILPVLMALSMYIQQRMSPEPTDPIQAQMMRWLPVFLLFMFASFPSGLVIYWTWSNILSIIQQALLKRQGATAKPDVYKKK